MLLKVLIPQHSYEIFKEEGQPAVLYKSRELKRTESGKQMVGGVIHDSIFDYQHFCFDPAIYYGPEENYRRREQFMIEDWSKELD